MFIQVRSRGHLYQITWCVCLNVASRGLPNPWGWDSGICFPNKGHRWVYAHLHWSELLSKNLTMKGWGCGSVIEALGLIHNTTKDQKEKKKSTMDYLDVIWQWSGSYIRSKQNYLCWSEYTNILTDLGVNNLHILWASSLCVWCSIYAC